MSEPALPPSASTTLVILLGASDWPNSQGFQASKAFTYAAHGFRDYLLDSGGFGLPAANLLDLFDATSGASDQLEQLDSFLQQQSQALIATNQKVHDVLVYFVGHGGFVGSSQDFYLMPRRANAISLRASGLSIEALAEVLREQARQARRYLILDCCFAAAAFRSFQGGPDQVAIQKTFDAFTIQARSSGFPGRGTVLLCSSDQKSPSLLLPDESCTMFSRALLDVLRDGDLHRPDPMSLRDIKELAEDRLVALPEKNAPRPGLYSPDQSEGDVANVPLFPNLRAEQEHRRQAEEAKRRQAEEQARRIEEERIRKAKEAEQARLLEEERVPQAEEEERQRRVEEEWLNEGNRLYDLKRPEEALAAYEQALRLDPNYALAYFNKGFVLEDLKRPEEALAAYEETLRLDPNHKPAYKNRAYLLITFKWYEEALAAYEQALRLDPNDGDAYHGKGKTLEKLLRNDEAQQAYRRARQLGYR